MRIFFSLQKKERKRNSCTIKKSQKSGEREKKINKKLSVLKSNTERERKKFRFFFALKKVFGFLLVDLTVKEYIKKFFCMILFISMAMVRDISLYLALSFDNICVYLSFTEEVKEKSATCYKFQYIRNHIMRNAMKFNCVSLERKFLRSRHCRFF